VGTLPEAPSREIRSSFSPRQLSSSTWGFSCFQDQESLNCISPQCSIPAGGTHRVTVLFHAEQ
jgi:hypothetical protein